MNRKRRVIILGVSLAGLTALLLGAALWRIDRLYRQEQQNHALIAAIKAQKRAQALELLAEGADANARDNGPPPGFAQMCRRLFEQVGRKAKPADETQRPTALILACRSLFVTDAQRVISETHPPDEEIALALLEHGADPNVRGESAEFGISVPIALALYNHQPRLLRSLLEHGANPNVRGFEQQPDMSPLLYILRWPNYILRWPNNSSEMMLLLLEHGADVNAADEHGSTPLMEAVGSGDANCVRLLLQRGAKPNAKDALGQTPLSIALQIAELERINPGGYPNARKIVALLKQYEAQ